MYPPLLSNFQYHKHNMAHNLNGSDRSIEWWSNDALNSTTHDRCLVRIFVVLPDNHLCSFVDLHEAECKRSIQISQASVHTTSNITVRLFFADIVQNQLKTWLPLAFLPLLKAISCPGNSLTVAANCYADLQLQQWHDSTVQSLHRALQQISAHFYGAKRD